MSNLSAVVLTHNSQATIAKTLASIKELNNVDDLIIVDDFSTDQTLEIVKSFQPKIIRQHLESDFSKHRNFAMRQAKNNFVLLLDADELLSRELIFQISKLKTEGEKFSAYLFKREDWFFNSQLRFGEAGSIWVPRLVEKTRGKFTRPVHEVWSSKYPVKKISGKLFHYPHPTITAFLKSVNYYSTINAQYFKQTGKKTNCLDIVFTPLAKFIYTFFFKLGFLDKEVGFIYSFMMSLHSFLSRAKLYLLIEKEKK